jgi:peptide/nickel transport system substrate-binding protein
MPCFAARHAHNRSVPGLQIVEFKPTSGSQWRDHYWKKGRPYLDRIEYTIIPTLDGGSRLYRRQVRYDLPVRCRFTAQGHQEPGSQAICDLAPGNASTNLIINRDKPPFDNPKSGGR